MSSEPTYVECTVYNNQRKSIETQQTIISTLSNSYDSLQDYHLYYSTYDAIYSQSHVSLNVDQMWQLDSSTLEYQKPYHRHMI